MDNINSRDDDSSLTLSCLTTTNEMAGGDFYGFTSVDNYSFDGQTTATQCPYHLQQPSNVMSRQAIAGSTSDQKQSFRAWMWSKSGPLGGNKRAMSEQGETSTSSGSCAGSGSSGHTGHLWNPNQQYRSGYKRTSAPVVRDDSPILN